MTSQTASGCNRTARAAGTWIILLAGALGLGRGQGQRAIAAPRTVSKAPTTSPDNGAPSARAESAQAKSALDQEVSEIARLSMQDDPAAEAALVRMATSSRDEILRAESVAGLGALASRQKVDNPAVTVALTAALTDQSPRVRYQAVIALERTNRAKANLLAPVLRGEHWTFVRTEAARALGKDCTPPSLEALDGAARLVGEDDDVRRASLASLDGCDHDRAANLALALLETKAPAAVVSMSCHLAARNEAAYGRRVEALVTRLLEPAKSSGEPKLENRLAAADCVTALGASSGPGGDGSPSPLYRTTATRILDTAKDSRIKIAAVLVLGRSCHPDAVTTLRATLQKESQQEVRSAAARAAVECQRRSPRQPEP